MTNEPPVDPSPFPSFEDSYSPRDIARRVERLGVAKARTDAVALVVLAVLAGAFISLGGLLFVVVTTGSTSGFGATRLLGGASFSLGLVLVVIAGAELFTGNNLIAMAWASRLVSARDVTRNWLVVYAGNVAGCVATAALVAWANIGALGDGAVARALVQLARTKAELPFDVVLVRGVLCNALVCLAVWLAMGGRTVTDKVVAIVFPVTAFVALGLEHSIANWFFFAVGMLLDDDGVVTLVGVARNLAAATVGNVIGGTLLVAGVYWVAYLRKERSPWMRE